MSLVACTAVAVALTCLHSYLGPTMTMLQSHAKKSTTACAATLTMAMWICKHIDKWVAKLLLPCFKMHSNVLLHYCQEAHELHAYIKAQVLLAKFVCHLLYHSASIIQKFSAMLHIDNHNTNWAFWLNFDGLMWICFPKYRVELQLQPFDMLFF
jgi:hypothetical protein